MQQISHFNTGGMRTVLCLGGAAMLGWGPPPQAQAQHPAGVNCTEWSPWNRVTEKLEFSYQLCEQTAQRLEVLWKWSNFSDEDFEFTYWVHLRDPLGCIDKVRGALTSGQHTLAARTTQDLDGRASILRSRYEGVFVCISYAGQPADLPSVGTRVRLSTAPPRGHDFVGTLTALGPEDITLAVESSDGPFADSTLTLPLDRVDHLAVSRGIGSRATAGFTIGAFASMWVGAVVGAVTASHECRDRTVFRDGRFKRAKICTGQPPVERAAIFGVISSIAGGAIGFVIGSTIQSERWETIRITLGPQAAGVAVSGSVTF